MSLAINSFWKKSNCYITMNKQENLNKLCLKNVFFQSKKYIISKSNNWSWNGKETMSLWRGIASMFVFTFRYETQTPGFYENLSLTYPNQVLLKIDNIYCLGTNTKKIIIIIIWNKNYCHGSFLPEWRNYMWGVANRTSLISNKGVFNILQILFFFFVFIEFLYIKKNIESSFIFGEEIRMIEWELKYKYAWLEDLISLNLNFFSILEHLSIAIDYAIVPYFTNSNM